MGWNNQAVVLIVLEEEATGFSGLFGYSPAAGAGNLIFSVAAVSGTDPFGNSYDQGVTVYTRGGGLIANMLAGILTLGDTTSVDTLTYNTLMRLIPLAAHDDTPIVAMDSPAADSNGTHTSLWLIGASQNYVSGDNVQAALFGYDKNDDEQPVQFIMCGNVAAGEVLSGLPTPIGWAVPTLGSGFSSTGSPFAPVSYQPEPVGTGGRVRLRGQLGLTANQSANAVIFTLPAAYAPAYQQYFTTQNNLSGAAYDKVVIDVPASGEVLLAQSGSSGETVQLDGIVIELD